jgi:hypothetical protein
LRSVGAIPLEKCDGRGGWRSGPEDLRRCVRTKLIKHGDAARGGYFARTSSQARAKGTRLLAQPGNERRGSTVA